MYESIVLNKEIPCEILCKKIQSLVQKYTQQHGSNSSLVLYLELKTIIDSEADDTIKLLDKKI